MLSGTKLFLRRAALLLAVGQTAMGFAPLLESGAASTVAHVEASGTQLHYAHDEADCVACAAHKLVGGVPLSSAQHAAFSSLPQSSPALVFVRPVAAKDVLPPATGPPSPRVV